MPFLRNFSATFDSVRIKNLQVRLIAVLLSLAAQRPPWLDPHAALVRFPLSSFKTAQLLNPDARKRRVHRRVCSYPSSSLVFAVIFHPFAWEMAAAGVWT